MEHVKKDSEITREVAQVLVQCSLCPNKAELICNTCRFNLCVACGGEHVISSPFQNHDVIKCTLKYNFFPHPYCSTHSEQRCEIHCEQCNLPLCSVCILSKVHSEHELSRIEEMYVASEKKINSEIEFLKVVVAPEVEKIVEKLKNDILELQKNSDILKTDVSKHGAALRSALDRVIKEQLENIDAAEKKDMATLQDNLVGFQRFLDTIHEIIRKNEELIDARNDNIYTFESQLEVLKQIPQTLQMSFPQFQPSSASDKKISKLMGNFKPSTCEYKTETALLSRLEAYSNFLAIPHIITDIHTEYDPLYRISCLTNEKAWISGNDVILREINTKGAELGKIKEEENIPFGLATTRKGELFYTVFRNKSIKNKGKTHIKCD
ncbi:E3 ubiquitin-protein ligase Trim36-like [Saccostrea cucullata]|uniref:E3 ubiquitin-protein ligase Trim36-like n=1 Tax=Saccostrea cuccullata TaxID=36930 RepID=UPI002ED52EE9